MELKNLLPLQHAWSGIQKSSQGLTKWIWHWWPLAKRGSQKIDLKWHLPPLCKRQSIAPTLWQLCPSEWNPQLSFLCCQLVCLRLLFWQNAHKNARADDRTDFLADLAYCVACNLVLVLKSFDVSIIQVDLAFKRLDQHTKGLDWFRKPFDSLGVTVDLGVQIVNEPRINPFLAE